MTTRRNNHHAHPKPGRSERAADRAAMTLRAAVSRRMSSAMVAVVVAVALAIPCPGWPHIAIIRAQTLSITWPPPGFVLEEPSETGAGTHPEAKPQQQQQPSYVGIEDRIRVHVDLAGWEVTQEDEPQVCVALDDGRPSCVLLFGKDLRFALGTIGPGAHVLNAWLGVRADQDGNISAVARADTVHFSRRALRERPPPPEGKPKQETRHIETPAAEATPVLDIEKVRWDAHGLPVVQLGVIIEGANTEDGDDGSQTEEAVAEWALGDSSRQSAINFCESYYKAHSAHDAEARAAKVDVCTRGVDQGLSSQQPTRRFLQQLNPTPKVYAEIGVNSKGATALHAAEALPDGTTILLIGRADLVDHAMAAFERWNRVREHRGLGRRKLRTVPVRHSNQQRDSYAWSVMQLLKQHMANSTTKASGSDSTDSIDGNQNDDVDRSTGTDWQAGDMFDYVLMDGLRDFAVDAATFALVDRLVRAGGYIEFEAASASASASASRRGDADDQYTAEQEAASHVQLVVDVLVASSPCYRQVVPNRLFQKMCSCATRPLATG